MRDKFNSKRFFQPQKVDNINRFFADKIPKYKLPVDEIEAYRIHKYKKNKKEFKKIYGSLQNYLEAEKIRDGAEEYRLKRMFPKSKRCGW